MPARLARASPYEVAGESTAADRRNYRISAPLGRICAATSRVNRLDQVQRELSNGIPYDLSAFTSDPEKKFTPRKSVLRKKSSRHLRWVPWPPQGRWPSLQSRAASWR